MWLKKNFKLKRKKKKKRDVAKKIKKEKGGTMTTIANELTHILKGKSLS
jgi:hypothetical protein